MNSHRPLRPLRVEVLSATVFWLFVTFLYVAQIMWLASRPGERINLGTALVWQAGFYLCWIPFTVLVWRFASSWSPAVLGWPRYLSRHVGLATAAAALHSILVIGVATAILGRSPETLGQVLIGQLRGRGYFEALIYAGVAAAGHALWLYDQWRDRETQAARLEAQLAAQRLSTLQSQIQPHFLFNSLHTIASLARDGRNADVVKMVADLSELLRRVMDPAVPLQPLATEVDLARRYLDIQHVRFGDRLRVAFDVADGIGDVLIPTLTLQPLVDNAVRHGLSSLTRGGTVRVSATAGVESITLRVDDDGVGLSETGITSVGTGLENLRVRLDILFAGRASLVAGPGAGGGFTVEVTVPRR